MLTAERYEQILNILAESGSVTVPALSERMGISESTVRRDLNELDKQGRLVKVHGGAVSSTGTAGLVAKDDMVADKRGRNHEEKLRIAKAAAALIGPEDFVYIDAGTTTELLATQVNEPGATYVTNSHSVAKALAEKGLICYLPGGQFKAVTEALVGEGALLGLAQYNFTIGFFGANGVGLKSGFTTPEPGEAAVKRQAWGQCKNRYVVADGSKLGKIAPVGFAAFESGTLITTGPLTNEFKACPNIIEA